MYRYHDIEVSMYRCIDVSMYRWIWGLEYGLFGPYLGPPLGGVYWDAISIRLGYSWHPDMGPWDRVSGDPPKGCISTILGVPYKVPLIYLTRAYPLGLHLVILDPILDTSRIHHIPCVCCMPAYPFQRGPITPPKGVISKECIVSTTHFPKVAWCDTISAWDPIPYCLGIPEMDISRTP